MSSPVTSETRRRGATAEVSMRGRTSSIPPVLTSAQNASQLSRWRIRSNRRTRFSPSCNTGDTSSAVATDTTVPRSSWPATCHQGQARGPLPLSRLFDTRRSGNTPARPRTQINAPFAPQIYRGVVAITRDAIGPPRRSAGAGTSSSGRCRCGASTKSDAGPHATAAEIDGHSPTRSAGPWRRRTRHRGEPGIVPPRRGRPLDRSPFRLHR